MRTWIKITLIVIAILFVLENIFWVWVFWSGEVEDEKENQCLYNICSEYANAGYEEGVCACYDYDMLGELIVKKTEYLG